jgi:hypothetical protein
MKNGRQRRISTKETNSKKALKIAEEFERAVKTKRTLEQVQQALDRLHEEVSGQNVNRTHLSKASERLADRQEDGNRIIRNGLLSGESRSSAHSLCQSSAVFWIWRATNGDQ